LIAESDVMPRAVWVSFSLPFIAVCSLNALQLAPSRAPKSGQAAASQAAGDIPPERALLNKYCVTCHNQRVKAASLVLDRLGVDVADVAAEAATWEKVVKKLRSGAMPPAGAPRPDRSAVASLAASLEAALDGAAAAAPNPGRASAHRLNRGEYVNAIRDLLALDIDGQSLLPPDPVGYGFDNIGDILSVSPALLERYMVAAGTISRLAVGDAAIRPVTQTYSVPYTMVQDDRISEDLPFGSRGGLAVRHYFPLDGDYLVKIVLQRAYQNQIRGLGERNRIELRLDRRLLKQFTVGAEGPRNAWAAVSAPSLYEQMADAGLEVRVNARAGTQLVSASIVKETAAAEGVLEPRPGVSTLAYSRDRNAPMAIDRIEISGPHNAVAPQDTPSRRRIFACTPSSSLSEDACARTNLTTLARRAYRRPVTGQDVQPLMALYREGRAKGSFDLGIAAALRGILVDPEFLFHIERDPDHVVSGRVYRLSDVELASRLSFFLWSSIPDEELLGLAEIGTLRDQTVLEQQVARMLRDSRSAALIRNFFGQWLLLRNVRTRAPDPVAFPDFDENLREAMQRETELFVDSQVRQDRSVVDLLAADYTFLNERLARHYGIPRVYGDHFRRVTLPDTRRGGLLGQASILMVTSYPNRTSPTLRGLWVLDGLLGAPPPPPPANVASLPEENGEHGKAATIRERMARHRTNAVCGSCHARMDPLGFALENFDGIGMWRTAEGNTPIDASGTLPDGSRLDGPGDLRRILLSRRDEFVQNVTEKLLTFALGRGLEYYDAPAVRTITRDAAPSDFRWSSLIAGIVRSVPFQMRRSRES
jgi:mono/diheme cytochrome c family protein